MYVLSICLPPLFSFPFLPPSQAANGSSPWRYAGVQRLCIRVLRSKVLQSAERVLELFGGQRAMLEVEFSGEVGTGLGPSLEFYSLVCKVS